MIQRRPAIRRLLAAAGGAAVGGYGCGSAEAFAWTVVKHHGRDYVTAKNIKEFYRFSSYGMSGRTLVFRSAKIEMRIVSGTDKLYINRVLFRLSFPVLAKGGNQLFSRIDFAKLIDPVLRPTRIATPRNVTTVIIDPGHGGRDPGSKGPFGYEKKYNLQLAYMLKTQLAKFGLGVRMTRTGDTYPTLGQRVVFANKVPDAIFVSLHFNHYKRTAAKGVETYALSPQGAGTHNDRGPDGRSLQGNGRDAENIALATAVHAQIITDTRAEDRGIKRDRFAVLAGINKPAILVEGGFLSNPTEARLIAKPDYLRRMAASIAKACNTYRKTVRR